MRSVANSFRFFVVGCGLTLASRSARAETVKLEDLEQRAVKNRGSLAAARARVDGAEARIGLAKVPYYPTLSARAGVNLAPGGRLVTIDGYHVAGSRELGDPGAFVPIFRYDTTVSLQSRLYDFGRTASAVRAARADRDATLAGVRSERQAIAVEVRAAFLSWLSAHGTREILALSARDATALRTNMEAHVAEGSRPGAELASARYEEARAELDLERSESDLVAARLEVEQAIGASLPRTSEPDASLLERPAAQPLVTATPVVTAPSATPHPATAAAATPPSAAALTAATHPEVEVAERRRDAATASAAAHGSPYAPILAVAADAGLRGQESTPFPLYQVGVSLTVPLLDGGLESASAAQASSQATELAAQARELRSRAALDGERSRSTLERSERHLALAERLVAAADETLKHSEDQRELGGGSFDAVVQARMQASRARLEVLAARLERARAMLDLTGAPQ